MTDAVSSNPSSPEMPHRIPTDNFYYNAPKSIIGTAGEGFRLSLELQLVGQQPLLREELASADVEIQMIIKKISEFSLMLKQVGKIMDESRTIASPKAIKTATDIKVQSEQDFDEIKNMIEIEQKRDEEGHLCGIEVAEQVTRSFKKRRMQYLMGQLEYLKDSLAIMLQTLELGKEIASAHEGTKRAPSWKVMRQERAEIQNMIVVQHWSFSELEKLYRLAEKEAILEVDSSRQESPPPSYDAANPQPPNATLTIRVGSSPPRPPQEAEHAKAMVPFSGERSLEVMKHSMEQASAREEEALSAKVNDIVDHLLDEWTEVGNQDRYGPRRQIQARSTSGRNGTASRRAQVESDDSDSSASDSEYERSENIGGFYLEGPRNAVKKNVRFNPRVDDDIDEDDIRPRRTTKKHTLGTVDEYSSDTDSSTDDYSSSSLVTKCAPSQRRRSNDSSGGYRPSVVPPSDRARRPYGGPPLNTSYESQPSPLGSRGMQQPPQPTPPRPVPVHGQTWTGAPNHLRPPQPPRQASATPSPYGSYNGGPPPPGGPSLYGTHNVVPSPGASPVSSSAGFFSRDPNYRAPPPGPPPGPQHLPVDRHRHKDRPHRRRTESQRQETRKKDETSASRNIKKGIFGGTAIAGIMELLQGLDGL